MTIEEIKEIRATVLPTEQEYFDAHSVEMVDTLLAEVDTLEKHNAYADQYNAVQDLHLTIATSRLAVATEALEEITEYRDQGNERECPYIARTALERIKE